MERNDPFGDNIWPSVARSLNSNLSNMFAYAVAIDHVPLIRVLKSNCKSLPQDVFYRPIGGNVLHLAATNGDGAMVGLLVPSTKTYKTGLGARHYIWLPNAAVKQQ